MFLWRRRGDGEGDGEGDGCLRCREGERVLGVVCEKGVGACKGWMEVAEME